MIDETIILAQLKQHRIGAFKSIVSDYSEAMETLAYSELGDRKLAVEIVNEVLYHQWVNNFSECPAPPIKDFLSEQIKLACRKR